MPVGFPAGFAASGNRLPFGCRWLDLAPRRQTAACSAGPARSSVRRLLWRQRRTVLRDDRELGPEVRIGAAVCGLAMFRSGEVKAVELLDPGVWADVVQSCGLVCRGRALAGHVEAHLVTVRVEQAWEQPPGRGAEDRFVRLAEVVEQAGELIESGLVGRAHLEVDPACGLRRMVRVEPEREERAAAGVVQP